MLISTIMLTFNREALIGRAVESVLRQTLADFELIIVDNGSTDRSGEIAERYALNDERLRVIRRERGSISEGRNAGLNAAAGDYIAFVDDDDWAEPDFLEFLYGLAVENDADVSICGAAHLKYEEKRVMPPLEALMALLGRKYYNVAFPTKMFRRQMFKTERFPTNGRFDDIALMYKLLANANRVAYHGLPKYTFYRHDGNHSAWTTNHSLLTPETLNEYLRVYRERTEWLSAKFPENSRDFAYFEKSFMISMVEKITRLGLSGCGKIRAALIKTLKEEADEFLNNADAQDFEKDWMRRYVICEREQ